MANPFRTMPSSSTGYDMNSIKQMYQVLMNSRNPMQVFEQMAYNSPQMKPVLQALRQGANPQSLFETLCRQKGVNPEDFLRSIQGKY